MSKTSSSEEARWKRSLQQTYKSHDKLPTVALWTAGAVRTIKNFQVARAALLFRTLESSLGKAALQPGLAEIAWTAGALTDWPLPVDGTQQLQ